MSDHERRGLNNAPDWLIWTMTFINRVGFPIAACAYLAWIQIHALPKIVEALEKVNGTMGSVTAAVNENTEFLKDVRRGH